MTSPSSQFGYLGDALRVQGRPSKALGKLNQDSCGYVSAGGCLINELPVTDVWVRRVQELSVPVCIVAVADGHGSVIRSDRGSQFAVQVALETLAECAINQHLPKPGANTSREARIAAVRRALDLPLGGDTAADPDRPALSLRSTIVNRWRQLVDTDLQGHPLSDADRSNVSERYAQKGDHFQYGSTLLAAMVYGDLLLKLQIGDGDFISLPTAASGERLVQPKTLALGGSHDLEGEFTESICLDQADEAMDVEITVIDETFGALLLSSDGYSKSFSSADDFREYASDQTLTWLKSAQARPEEYHLSAATDDRRKALQEVTDNGSCDDLSCAIIADAGFIERAPGLSIAFRPPPPPPAKAPATPLPPVMTGDFKPAVPFPFPASVNKPAPKKSRIVSGEHPASRDDMKRLAQAGRGDSLAPRRPEHAKNAELARESELQSRKIVGHSSAEAYSTGPALPPGMVPPPAPGPVTGDKVGLGVQGFRSGPPRPTTGRQQPANSLILNANQFGHHFRGVWASSFLFLASVLRRMVRFTLSPAGLVVTLLFVGAGFWYGPHIREVMILKDVKVTTTKDELAKKLKFEVADLSDLNKLFGAIITYRESIGIDDLMCLDRSILITLLQKATNQLGENLKRATEKTATKEKIIQEFRKPNELFEKIDNQTSVDRIKSAWTSGAVAGWVKESDGKPVSRAQFMSLLLDIEVNDPKIQLENSKILSATLLELISCLKPNNEKPEEYVKRYDDISVRLIRCYRGKSRLTDDSGEESQSGSCSFPGPYMKANFAFQRDKSDNIKITVEILTAAGREVRQYIYYQGVIYREDKGEYHRLRDREKLFILNYISWCPELTALIGDTTLHNMLMPLRQQAVSKLHPFLRTAEQSALIDNNDFLF